MKTPEEIKKGLECCSRSDSCPQECPYYDVQSCGSMSKLDALAYIQQLEGERNAVVLDHLYESGFVAGFKATHPRWISVKDDIPVNEDDVLVLLEGKHADIAWFNGYDGTWHTNGYYSGTVTHWMPLPELPKDGENHG